MASDKSRKRIAKKYGDMPDKWDDWHVRLPNQKGQIRVIDLYHKSGSMSKSEFVRGRILGESFKVITVDKSAVEYYRKLSELTAQIHKIGVLYNQTVRAINSYHSVTTAQICLKNWRNETSAKLIVQNLLISSYFCTFIV
ncbi:hypothetical protein [Hoylesella timonensis]|uniref:plasmid mobilization protein n=1 Tax=Hoylesella timonensis TaxID=386414 RepID=UPI00242DFED5|nr:hypothetical protein [Hoylesella timonensis]